MPSRIPWENEKSLARCSLCDGELYCGARVWRFHGRTVCRDCFPDFANEILVPYQMTLGEETEI